MRLQGSNGELLVVERVGDGPSGTPAEDDFVLDVSVSMREPSHSGPHPCWREYSATDRRWVTAKEWHTFLHELDRLEEARQGRATLTAPEPGELTIVFRSTDPAGHVEVSGVIGRCHPSGPRRRLEFEFEFDPGLLATVVKEIHGLTSPAPGRLRPGG